MSNVVDMINRRIGKLVVSKRAGTLYNQASWLCVCDCGKAVEYSGADLRSEKVISCGCEKVVLHGDPINRVIHAYVTGASGRGLSFNLSRIVFEDLIANVCHYCGRKPEQTIKVGAKFDRIHPTFRYNGIDRVDNYRGYEPDNVVTCCKRCNRAKDTMSQKQFLELIDAIYKRRIEPK